jgi:hypothetical protein
VANKIKSFGFTMEDMLFSYMGRTLHEDDLKKKKWQNWSAIHEEIFDKVEGIMRGDIAVDYRDGRTYAQVIGGEM